MDNAALSFEAGDPMKRPTIPHKWNLSPREAIALQKRLADMIRTMMLDSSPRYVAGGDVAFRRNGRELVAGWVVWDLQTKTVLETSDVLHEVTFPYVPGLLSFREGPALLAAAARLKTEPDVFMLDGHGLAHPRRIGIASHVGLLMNRPSCGCAKSRLCGTHAEPADRVGSSTRLLHGGDVVGRVVRTRKGVKPIYVSVGHRITLDDAVRLTLRCCDRYRLPEPTRLAHHLVTDRRKALDEASGKAPSSSVRADQSTPSKPAARVKTPSS